MIPATPAHAAAMAAIHAAAFQPGAQWGPDVMALQLGLPGAFGFIDPAGGFVLARVAADEAEIITLAVAPEARRRGIARALLQQAMTRAATAGAATMVLEVAAANLAAAALYAGAGFVQAGHRPRYYPDGADALIMRAPLPSCG